jgi:nitroimidazol reductase NimA-like FMN-containing flavoprotein (pyridoxamine 5'-phosphate oxidase superfamily)
MSARLARIRRAVEGAVGIEIEDLDGFLARELTCVVGVNRPGRAPLVFPMWFRWEPSAQVISITTAATSKKVPLIEREPQIMVLVEAETEYMRLRGVQFEGRAEVIRDQAIARPAHDAMWERYQNRLPRRMPPHLERLYAQGDRVLIRLRAARTRSWDFARIRYPEGTPAEDMALRDGGAPA